MPNPQSPSAKLPDIMPDSTVTTPAKPKDNAEPNPIVKKTLAVEKSIDDNTKKLPTKKPLDRLKKAKPTKTETPTPPEFMATEYKGVSIYAMAMAILIGLILWTGIATVQQVQAYHQQYSNLQQLKKDYRKLQIENQRLLIEQQTFSATPQIASRAVAELNMFYPQLSDRMIIQANNIATKPTNLSNTATATAHPTQNLVTKPTPRTATAQTNRAEIANAHIENAPIQNRQGTTAQPKIDNSAEYEPEQGQDGQGAHP